MTRVRRIADLIDPESTRPQKRRPSGKRPVDAQGRPVRARSDERERGFDLAALLARLGLALGGVAMLAVVWIQPIRSVEVRGVRLAPAETLAAILVGEVGQRWATAPVRQLETALACDPWIDGVQVQRATGGRLVVEIDEAEPILQTMVSGRNWAVDVSGRLLPAHESLDLSSLPALHGVRADAGELVFEDRDEVGRLLDALAATPWAWAGGIRSIDLGGNGPAKLITGGDVTLVFDVEHAPAQLRHAGAAWAEVSPQPGQSLDLRFERQIVVRAADGERNGNGG